MSLSKESKQEARHYTTMSASEKTNFINQAYWGDNASYREIADAAKTYPNKIRRDAKELGIGTRDKSKAQSIAIDTGRHKHPTKGTHRSLDTKVKISEGRAQAWEDLTPAERQRLSDVGKQQWAAMSEADRQAFQKAAGDAIRKASKEGSKLEKFLRMELINAGYKVEFHKERIIQNEKLQMDLWLPKLNVAIEVDGPSHFEPIWGAKTLARNQQSDSIKSGLLLSRGMVLIRVKQNKTLSQKFKRNILSILLDTLQKIDKKFPPRGDRHILLEC